MRSTAILATTLLGSLLQHAAAAPEASSRRAVQYPDCISTCMRNSGCFDSACICKKAAAGILSDIVICMNQWCPADVTATDLIEPLAGQCDLPKAAVQDAEKKGGVADDTNTTTDDGGDETTTTSVAKPTATAASSAKSSSSGSEVTMTFDVGKPQTAAAEATTTVKPSVTGTLTIATDAATTGLLTDDQDEPTATGSLAAGTSTSVTFSSSSTAVSGSGSSSGSTNSTDDEGNAAGLRGQASVFGVVAAMGVALALGF